MQPDRSCYIRRAADERLLDTIAAQRFAYVLAPRAMGKSSLMGRAIRRLRADGQLAAVIDLTQIGSRVEGVDSARWHYSIAYRIVRELRLKVDLQSWWQDKGLLVNEQRLVEFFWDVVLSNTSKPVTIFFDDAERAVDLPFASELFAALHSCHMRRVSEPDYTRLNFVVLGVAAPGQLCPDASVSPFIDGRAIALEDFTLAECKGFAPGFELDAAVAETVIGRIHAWTHGQPCLTQKLARAAARKGARRADQIDALTQELFLASGTSREDPLLNHMRGLLAGRSPRCRQAIAILGRLGAGLEVIDDPGSAAQRLLQLAGIVSSDENGMLRFRNRIVEQVFGRSFARSVRPIRWRLPAAAAAAAALLALPVYWYTQVLPRPYVDTLTAVNRDYPLALQAHERLGRLPGFGARADRLLADAMVRQSTRAETIDELLAADAVLRGLPGRAALADELKARFWLRRSAAMAREGRRDQALVHALAAAEGGLSEARPVAAELIGSDYERLARSFHLPVPPLTFEVDWQRDTVVVIDDTHRVHRFPLSSGQAAESSRVQARLAFAERLTALQHVGVSRGLSVDGTGRAGAFELRLAVEHGRIGDLLVRLRAPSGAAVELELPRREGPFERFIFTASAANGLARLADESVTGHWELTVFDRLSGETGTLVSWGLSFAGLPQTWDDEPIAAIGLPDPGRTELVDVVLARGGRTAVAVPSRPGVGGALSVWDLGSGEIVADIPIVAPPAALELLADGRLLVVNAGRASLWRVDSPEPLAVLDAPAGFVGPPALSPAGDFFALGERHSDAAETAVEVGLYRAADGERIARFISEPWRDWVVAPEAAHLVMIDGSRRGTVIDPSTGQLIAEFLHVRELADLLAVPSADRVVAVDDRLEIVAWPLRPGQTTIPAQQSVYLGTTVAADSVDAAAGTLAFMTPEGDVGVRSLADGAQQILLGHGGGARARTRLDAGGKRLISVTHDMLRAWQIDETTPGGVDLGDVSAAVLDPGGGFAALGFRSGRVGWLDSFPGVLAPTLSEQIGHRGVVTSLAVSRARGLVASGGSDGVVRVWSLDGGVPSRFVHPAGPITALALSADGDWMLSAGPSSARIWALASGAMAGEIEAGGAPLAVALASDGSLAAVGDSAGNIFLAMPGGAGGLHAVRGRSPITALSFGRGSTRLASGGRDGHVVLWDTWTASPVGGAHLFPDPVRWIDLADDGETVFVVSGSWLYVLDEAATPDPAVTRARLLPEALRGTRALARRPDGRLVGIGLAGGRLAPAEVGTDGAPASGADREIPARDWDRVLGLALDPATGAVRTIAP